MKTKTINLIVVSLIILSYVIFYLYDLNINIYLNNTTSPFGRFFDVWGEFPVYLGLPFFGLSQFKLVNQKHRYLYIVISLIGLYLAFVNSFGRISDNFILVNTISIFFSSIINLVLLKVISDLRPSSLVKFNRFAVYYLIASLFTAVGVELIKNIWGRTRFRNLGENYEGYSNFLKINFLGGSKSFPSGHSGAATSIIMLNLLTKFFKTSKSQGIVVYLLTVTWVISVALSRIIVGAHYPSDVLTGVLIGLLIQYLLYQYIYKRRGGINASSS